jgi:hypothetical protein
MNFFFFGPKKKSSPIYLGPKILDTFWWNCQIIFRCASIQGRAGFILVLNGILTFYHWCNKTTFYRLSIWLLRFLVIFSHSNLTFLCFFLKKKKMWYAIWRCQILILGCLFRSQRSVSLPILCLVNTFLGFFLQLIYLTMIIHVFWECIYLYLFLI